MTQVVCPECGNSFSHISNHWNYNESHREEFTERQIDIITGLLMGDGTINTNAKNPRFSVSMINEEFLHHLDDVFGILSTGVKKVATADELADKNRRADFSTTVNEEKYHDVYRVATRTHPQLEQFVEWYSSGEKIWPEDIALTPTVLKYLYVSDGSIARHGYDTNVIHIAMANEVDELDKVSSYFDDIGVEQPNYNIYEYDDGHIGCDARFTVESSKHLWEYMGEPLPGFEYKWP